jgi:uncharacterized membrane protein HdeD (DUF308 family)
MTSSELPSWTYWVFLVRGCLAFALGAALLVSGSGLSPLGNFLAVYWIVGAVLTLRRASGHPAARGRQLAATAGLTGIVAGSLVLRELLDAVVEQGYLLELLGLCAIATGLPRLAGGFRDDQLATEMPRGRYRLVVGTLDVGLGVALLLVSEDTSPSSGSHSESGVC